MLHLLALVAAAPFSGTITYQLSEPGQPAEAWTAAVAPTTVAVTQGKTQKRFIDKDGRRYQLRNDDVSLDAGAAGAASTSTPLPDRQIAGRAAKCLRFTPKVMPALDDKNPADHVEACVFVDERSLSFKDLGVGFSDVDVDALFAARKIAGLAASQELMGKKGALTGIAASAIDDTPPSVPNRDAFFNISPLVACQKLHAAMARKAAKSLYVAEESHRAEHDVYTAKLNELGANLDAAYIYVVTKADAQHFSAIVTGRDHEVWTIDETGTATQTGAAKCP